MSTDLIPAGSDNPLVPAGVQVSSVVPKITEPEDNLLKPSSAPKVVDITVEADGTQIDLVPVKGNSKVKRCRRCNTFVKIGNTHGLADCNARLSNKAHRKSRPRGRRFRLTPKRKRYLDMYIKEAATFREVSKRLKSVERWVSKREGKLSKNSKKMFVKLLESFHKSPKCKDAMFRKVGLSQ